MFVAEMQQPRDEQAQIFAADHHRGEKPAGKASSLINRIKALFSSEFVPVAAGADKIVWVRKEQFPPGDRSAIAYYTPNKAYGFSRKKQLKAEVQTYIKIEKKLFEKYKDDPNFECRLAVRHRVVEKHERIKGKYTIEVDKAEGDLEKAVTKKVDESNQPCMLSMEERLHLDLHQREGIAQLHAIGMIPGDAKLENILVYRKNGKLEAKVSDFGRAVEYNGIPLKNKGNTRTIDPSGKISPEGDVWALAINTLRILEESLVADKGFPIGTMEVAHHDRECEAHPCRRGVDKFILEHSAFLAVENRGTRGKFKNACRRNCKKMPSEEICVLRQDLMRIYSTKTIARLLEQKKISESTAQQLHSMLFASFDVNPSNRPTAQATVDTLRRILADL